MALHNHGTAVASERVLIITRTFDAPRELVFDAWTKCEHVARWFGPKDFTVPHCSMDFRVGGSYRYCMLGPDGKEHWVSGTYKEIKKPEKLVFTWVREDNDGKVWLDNVVTLTFADRGNQTAFTLNQQIFEEIEQRDGHRGGWSTCLDKLAEFVENKHQS
ncbi:MAG: SRPBCC domain-containing protein [Candidatus Hydrogenedentes bacterium]|nr:SRPBCC domain-containing protein [Candidatus Hydrogenedentota bacterium]